MIVVHRQTPNTSSRRDRPIQCVVIHATAGSLRGSLSWLTSVASGVSADFVVDKNGTVYQLNHDMRARFTWHAGASDWRGMAVQKTLNPVSVGIELVNANDGRDPYPPAQVTSAALLTALLCSTLSIPVAHVCGHYECALPAGRKTDPRGLSMDEFRNRVARILESNREAVSN